MEFVDVPDHLPQHFPARVSMGLLGFIGLVFFGPLAWEVWRNGYQPGYLPVIGLLIGLYGLILYGMFGTKYSLEAGQLVIRMGLWTYARIPVAAIRKVEPSRSILSAPAPSLRRLEITYNRYDSVVISPKDQQGFLEALALMNPNIHMNLNIPS
jgi:hypothetical protein